MKLISKLFMVSFFITSLTGCVTTAQINEEAAQSYTSVVQEARSKGVIDTTSDTAKRVTQVFNQMKPYAQKANKTGVPFDWQITVMRSDELNAWAMPGGKMMFYTGLVERLHLSNDEIATVMGHEMAHALQEHGKQDRTVSTITGVAAAAGKIALATQGISTEFGGFDAVDVLKSYGIDRPFSRSQETEADEVGLMLMAEAGFNPETAPQIWQKMSAASGSSNSVLESLVSTHPVNADREANLKRLMPKALEIYQASRGK